VVDQYRIGISQTGSTIKVVSARHPACFVKFLVNEVVRDRHFSKDACEEFKARVSEIWGPGGRRHAVELDADGKRVNAEGVFPWDGKFGKFPDSRVPDE
jgi:hypothetical protein